MPEGQTPDRRPPVAEPDLQPPTLAASPQQPNSTDCGVYAIRTAFYLVAEVEVMLYHQAGESPASSSSSSSH
ncbi:hypothetical protein PG985_007348 [Apiospora marii]|uniref:Ubiquitin-like protease family profile domain-containing protein n=1 Tax=Apiospora marii TaxID=335849 RepID=A0ABR1SNV5_9PEZI